MTTDPQQLRQMLVKVPETAHAEADAVHVC